MSNHSIMDNKQRLSTITTSAALSNNRRLKTTLANQFNTMILGKDKKVNSEQQIQEKKYKNHNLYIPLAGDKKQSRRYSQADWSLRTHHQSLNLKNKPLKVQVQQINKKSVGSLQTQQEYMRNKANKIRIKSQYDGKERKIVIPYQKFPNQQLIAKQVDLVNSDQYMEQLQKEKNRRIQQIYNPQSIGASKIVQSTNKSISALRKNKTKGVNINKFGADQLLESLKNGRHAERSRQYDKSSMSANSRQASKSREERLSHQKKQSLQRINILVSDNYSREDHHKRKPQNSYSGPRILPVTFQRVQQLSTIKQSAQGSNKNGKRNTIQINKQKLMQHGSFITQQKYQYDHATDALSVSSKSRTINSQNSLPFPKFNNFIQNYQRDSKSNTQTKTYLFKVLKNIDTKKSTQQQNYENSDIKKQKIQQLAIFNAIDKSSLRVIKSNQGVYYGQLNESGLKNGKGAFFYRNGKVYQGEFCNDVKEGQGSQQCVDGSMYVGQFKNGKRNGKGRFEWPNGQVYDGQWLNNLKHGSGLWQSKQSVASYIGEWSNGQISGFGVLTNEKGQRYEGQFQNFNKEGQGTFRFQNGDRLVGNFKRNQPNGQCEYFWLNGDYYKGDFSNGLRHGKGSIKYSDDSYFEGQFRNDKKCGLGREHYSDGIIYYGNFENDLRHGFGKLIYNQEVYYEGYWLNNVAVIFQERNQIANQIIEDQKQRLASGFSNNLSANKLKKLNDKEQQKILKSMRSKAQLKKSKIQKFSSKNLLQRLCQPKKRCKCLQKH